MLQKTLMYLFACQYVFLANFATGDAVKSETSCVVDEFPCDDNNNMVPSGFLCDGVNDCKDGSDEAELLCKKPMQILLSNDSSGALLIRSLNKWAPMLDDKFTEQDAKVICRTLGYVGPSLVIRNGKPELKWGRIWLGSFNCVGSESSIEECQKLTEIGIGCNSFPTVSVSCSSDSFLCGKGPYYSTGHRYVTDDPSIKTFTEIDDHGVINNTSLRREVREISTRPRPRQRRVVNGQMAHHLQNYPWIADISLSTNQHSVGRTSRSYHMCGAAIISEYFVLTAAHCLYGLKDYFRDPNKWVSILRITAAEYNQHEDEYFEQIFTVDDVVIHEDYVKRTITNDIALLKLKPNAGHGIHFNKFAQPICLPSADTPLVDDTIALAGGWGISKTKHQDVRGVTKYLYLGELPILSHSLCSVYANRRLRLTTDELCTGHNENLTDTCSGDSGGPLVQNINGRFTLLGLTSHGYGCGKKYKPGFYANVKHFLPWILHNIREMKAKE